MTCWLLVGCIVLSIMAVHRGNKAILQQRRIITGWQTTTKPTTESCDFAQEYISCWICFQEYADNNQGCVEEVGGGKWEEVGGSEGDQTYWWEIFILVVNPSNLLVSNLLQQRLQLSIHCFTDIYWWEKDHFQNDQLKSNWELFEKVSTRQLRS